jgi:transposase
MHKKHDKAFKEHAVNLWLGGRQSAQVIADQLGCKRDRLYAWKHELERSGRPSPRPVAPKDRTAAEWQEEVQRLQRQNQWLRQEREILKKTLGILSAPAESDTNGLSK